MGRRELLHAGIGWIRIAQLADLLRARAAQEAAAARPEETAIILVWLRRLQPSRRDPKPTREYRGPFASIATRQPGIVLTELLPKIADVADRFTLLRSVAHTGGGHPAGSLQVLSGDRDASGQTGPRASRLDERGQLRSKAHTAAVAELRRGSESGRPI
ncbi:MAG: hypothetical protein R3B96_04320 [Pirellulaceae bacterium]